MSRDGTQPSAGIVAARFAGAGSRAGGTCASSWSARCGRLPDHQRVPLVLFHFEEMSYQEIADALGVSLGKVKTDIHRGREALETQLPTDHASR